MSQSEARAPLVFAGLGHGLHHVLTGLFPTVVLVLAAAWDRPYDELIALWTLGALLLGLGAPLAGWLADRWGEVRLMILFFLGLGSSAVACGLASGPLTLQWALAGMGLFGAIYHPVGTAWIVKTSAVRGRAIATVGVCGAVGVALASLVAAVLTDIGGWRIAFILPGVITAAAGAVLIWCYGTGVVNDRKSDVVHTPDTDPVARRNTAIILVTTMCLTSVVWHAFATMLPKWLSLELGSVLGHGLTGIGAVVTLVFLVGAVAQFIGGHFADRGSAKQIYVASFVLKLAAFLLALTISGWPVIAVAIVIALVFDIAAPVENYLIAQYASARRRGLTYGLRHGIAIISAPLGVQIVSWLYDEGDGFRTLLLALALITLLILLTSMFLPTDQTRTATAAEAPGP